MSVRVIALFSLGLNILLVAAHLRLSRTEEPPTRPASGKAPPPVTAVPLPTVPPEAVPWEVEPFHWNDVVSEDFYAYRDNLVEVGCPEPTVHDILISEVNRVYAARVGALLQPVQGQFWNLAAEAAYDEDAVEERFEPVVDALADLDQERRDLLKGLFDRAAPRPAGPAYSFSEHEQRLVDFLSPEQQERYAALQLEFATEYQALSREALAQGERLTREQRVAFLDRKERALQDLLTPEEYFEYQLRKSPLARVRVIPGVGLSAEEVREVAALRLQAQQQAAAQADDGLDDATRRLLVQRYGLPSDPAEAVEDQIRERIGEESYAQLKRAESSGYRELWLLGERTGLPTSTLNQLFDIRQLAQQKAQEVQQLLDWTAEDRAAAIEAIRSETERTLRETLPGQDFDNYSYAIGRWWDEGQFAD